MPFWPTLSGPGPQTQEGAFCFFFKKAVGENRYLQRP